MEDEICVCNLFEGAFEGFHHFHWQIGDEADSIKQGNSGA